MMFPPEVYINRKNSLIKRIDKGIILFLGNKEVSMNYQANNYPFRQDSSFLYYFGLDMPDLAAIIDAENGDVILYGNDPSIEDIIWIGKQEKLEIQANRIGIKQTKTLRHLDGDICKAIARRRKVHILPPYREQRRLQIADYCNLKYDEVDRNVSAQLIQAVVAQRSIKDRFELQDMEHTMSEVTCEAYSQSVQSIKPGKTEYDVAGTFEGVVLKKNCNVAYTVICSVRGEILHNLFHGNELKSGQLLLMDAGAESEMHYATDITRTYPVGGRFKQHQKDLYNIVLNAQMAAISVIKPEMPYRDIHFIAAKKIADGLCDMGFMKGNTEDAVQLGVHALFFPHGIGHMIGLDVHDMEDLGEDIVGYDQEFKRSEQFGTAYLRLAKRLKEGNVVTVEPGIYFIGALIDQWRDEGRYRDFLNYDVIEKFKEFGGIRIEDNIAVTKDGYRIIGRPIPKNPNELEDLLGG